MSSQERSLSRRYWELAPQSIEAAVDNIQKGVERRRTNGLDKPHTLANIHASRFHCGSAYTGCSVKADLSYLLKSDRHWIDAPPEYGPRKTLYNRYIRWATKGVWVQLFEVLAASGGPPKQVPIVSSATAVCIGATISYWLWVWP